MPDHECVDWAGTLHERAETSPRIACLVPSITELLFALDLGAHVVARTGFCVHPHGEVRRVPKIGGTKDADLARLAALAPTHLIVNVDENRREVVEAARAFVPHVVVTHPLRLDDNPRLYRLLGAVFAREHRARTLCAAFELARHELDHATRTLPRERVLYVIWKKPWMTISRDTYIADVLAAAGWDSVAPEGAVERYPVVRDEDGAWQRAQRILLSSEPYAFVRRDAQALARDKARPVDLIDAEMTSWYGPRAIEGMAYL
ncbi:MAG TPA: helical backbone metal receptor, partial [Casimicrobiaceae bacterium]|nr:helical backbone metal receptor [Casimicrobiaceae bacterium]